MFAIVFADFNLILLRKLKERLINGFGFAAMSA
jgi:hypothetical protein